MCTSVSSASAQKPCDSLACYIMVTIYWIVWFIVSATPFCSGLYGVVSSCRMSRCQQKLANLSDLNSPPLSNRRHFSWGRIRFQPLWVIQRRSGTHDLVCLLDMRIPSWSHHWWMSRSITRRRETNVALDHIRLNGPSRVDLTLSSFLSNGRWDFVCHIGNARKTDGQRRRA